MTRMQKHGSVLFHKSGSYSYNYSTIATATVPETREDEVTSKQRIREGTHNRNRNQSHTNASRNRSYKDDDPNYWRGYWRFHGRRKLWLVQGRAVKTGQAVWTGPFSPINYRAWALNIESEF
ncbi:hypothetical protein MTR_7g036835 [Medicago truncatula]|uniref:Uncharacterized protein n=1 Tax=Medicago truncatula TaxID=3880 RepID=A0A072U8W8_MEDTR|nr:hypothetical protein MTR_7g036835 [Medicago truncatula]